MNPIFRNGGQMSGRNPLFRESSIKPFVEKDIFQNPLFRVSKSRATQLGRDENPIIKPDPALNTPAEKRLIEKQKYHWWESSREDDDDVRRWLH